MRASSGAMLLSIRFTAARHPAHLLPSLSESGADEVKTETMQVVIVERLKVAPRAGVEPARPFGQRILSPQRLPFRHPGMLSVSLTIPSLCSLRLVEIRLPSRVGAGKDAGLVDPSQLEFQRAVSARERAAISNAGLRVTA